MEATTPRTTIVPVFALLLLLPAGSGCSVMARADLGRVLTSGRDGYQHPERVIAELELRQGDRVAEIGAGDGYWLPWLSEAVGNEGRVYAVEVDDEKVAELEQRYTLESSHDFLPVQSFQVFRPLGGPH